MMQPTDSGKLEEKIVRAAKDLFIENGYAATSMSEIAARAGIKRPVLYYYFRTKDKIFQAALGVIAQSLLPKIQNILLRKDWPFAERVSKVVDAYYDMFYEVPDLPMFVLREVGRDVERFHEALKDLPLSAYLQAVEESLQEEMQAGVLKKMPVRTVFITFYGLLTFPFLSRNLLAGLFVGQDETFEDILTEWKPCIVSQMEKLLCSD